jgi:hypothetical protein
MSEPEMGRQTPVFIVASPRTRVGKTLVARALAEYFSADGRPVAAFDVNPDEFALVEYLPAVTAVAAIDDTRGQMALFDQLVSGDATAKIVDLGAAHFEKFFAVMHQLALAREMRRQGIVPVLLFVADGDRRTQQAYGLLRHRFAELPLIPVINEAVPVVARYRDNFPSSRLGGAPLTIPALGAVIRGVTERPGFSFAAYTAKTEDTTTELYGWIRKVFLEFRDLELRLLLEELKPSLRFSA